MKIGGPMVHCRALVADPTATPRALADAAAALFEVRSSEHAVPVLLKLLKHPEVVVRIGACAGLAAHAVPLAIQALGEASETDPHAMVRAEAKRISDMIWNMPIECANGCGSTATLKDDADAGDVFTDGDDHHHAVFCSETCATEWALARVRDEMHVCLTELRWESGTEEDCETCQAATKIGETDPFDE